MFVVCQLTAIPLCEAGWDAVVTRDHFSRGAVAIVTGLVLGLLGISFHPKSVSWKAFTPQKALIIDGSLKISQLRSSYNSAPPSVLFLVGQGHRENQRRQLTDLGSLAEGQHICVGAQVGARAHANTRKAESAGHASRAGRSLPSGQPEGGRIGPLINFKCLPQSCCGKGAIHSATARDRPLSAGMSSHRSSDVGDALFSLDLCTLSPTRLLFSYRSVRRRSAAFRAGKNGRRHGDDP